LHNVWHLTKSKHLTLFIIFFFIQAELEKAVAEITDFPPLVFAGECRNLQERLAAASRGEAFIVQGGDCAEAFSQFNANRIRDLFRLILQMSVVVMFGGGVPVVKLGRLAGQFAKPRSADLEKKGDVSLPSYRGDIINAPEFTPEARIPNPWRLVKAYNQSAATLNLIRGFSTGGYAGLDRVTQWNLDFMAQSDEGKEYVKLAKRVDEAIKFMNACGLDMHSNVMKETEFYVSHECLLMDYEQALTREDSTTGLWYGCSGHFLWCGERTRQLDNAHVEYMRGIGNPIGVKVSDKMDPSELVALISTLNPENTPGRLAVIVRMGAKKLREKFPVLLEAVQAAGQTVCWVCDPMHGNTEDVNGYKTRRYDNIRAEVEAFFDIHEELGTVPGGIHLEMTGDNVTECIGGGSAVGETDLNSRYHTHCDPRMNAEQALEMSFYVASRLRQRKERLEREAQESSQNSRGVLLY
jgi:3-deoxy-7-phosphoheptulonate synthase